MPTSCLGTQCMVILVGTQTSYGLLWGIYIKVVCGLRRSPCCWQKIITIQRNPPTVQPTYVHHIKAMNIATLVSSFQVCLPLPTQAIISTCPPRVTTAMARCTTLIVLPTIGHLVLIQTEIILRTACFSTVIESTCMLSSAIEGIGSEDLSSPRNHLTPALSYRKGIPNEQGFC